MSTTPTTPPLAQWSERLAVNFAEMDATHQNFIDSVRGVQLADQDGLLAAVDGLIEHCIEHFEQEEQWMRDSNFPPLHCHENEHKQVLQVVQEVKRRLVEEGDVDLPRRLADELPLWLENHIDTMDYALSHFLKTLAEHGETAAAQTTKEGSGCGC